MYEKETHCCFMHPCCKRRTFVRLQSGAVRGLKGVVIGVALTHWPSLARLIRAEVIQLRESPYIQISCKLGKSSWYIARKHMLPHLVPQFIVGLVLMFPHAILHESSITFLGFGLSTEQPAIGIVLSEAMQYLITGKCWIPEVSISKEARRRKVWKKRQS